MLQKTINLFVLFLFMSLTLFAQSDDEYMEGTLYANEGRKVGYNPSSKNLL